MLKLVFLIFFNSIVEFLPISSTAHSILLSRFLSLEELNLNISLILSFSQLAIVFGLCFFFKREIFDIIKSLFSDTKNCVIFLGKIFITMLPTIIVGIFFYSSIKTIFSAEKSIAVCLILGAMLMFLAEKKYRNFRETNVEKFENIDFLTALKIGLFQSLSLIPGISRSASTISAGLLCNLQRKTAVLFSFFISIPVSVVAGSFDIYKNYKCIDTTNLSVILYCFVLSFLFSIIFSKKILNFLANHNLKIFIYYRIIFGLILLVLF